MSASPLPECWLVFFGDTPRPRWWWRLARRGFRHCFAAKWCEEGQTWLVVEPHAGRLELTIIPRGQFLRLRSIVATHTTVRFMSTCERAAMPFSAGWCCGSIKAILGIRSMALTPFGLFRELLARGAERVYPNEGLPSAEIIPLQGRANG